MVGKLDLRRRASGAIDVQSHLRDYRPYTRRYTSSNQKVDAVMPYISPR